MAVMYCDWCDRIVDLDWDVEHFDSEDQCVLHLEEQEIEKEQANEQD